ncbi:outer membrane lipase/esterase [Sphingomonas jejuensis]|uniref:Outer membrane lipase/esterase n=1 Tax=Sphingomonas jejuensis TaxID=904715 RepID=A0ABX0XMT2_9SPHN|nr:SGNH/GDSL hydrolase family protein [Sphingomonas jejuensis]NJC34508.1 outer membrane lipase/esterase [Sphingomonas jejuensis]
MKIAGCAATIGLALAAPAGAQNYSNLFVFGDSLVDSGNARAARLAVGGVDPAPPAQGYFEGRFSNGYNFADYLSLGLFNTPATASALGGLNFSVGGAQAAEVPGDASPSFAEQIASFQGSGLSFNPDSLVLLTFGGNDVRRELGRVATIPNYVPDFSETLAAFSTGVSDLIGLGARNIIVTGLPDIGQIPVVTALGSADLSRTGTQLSFGLNQALAQQTSLLGAQAGLQLSFFDLFAFQQALYADPTAAGLPANLNTRTPCLAVPGAAPTCTGFVYFDGIHPTTQVHAVIGDALVAQAQAVPEPATWAMMIAGFGAVGLTLRARRRADVRLAA